MKTIRRRRREAKTDYKARFNLLKAERPRLVVRKTNKYIIAQIIDSNVAQDKTLFRVVSKDLLNKGWPKDKVGSLKSNVAAYLTGYLLGKMTKSTIKKAVFDIGLQRNIAGSRLYATLKGAVDAGLEISHNEKAFPSEERISPNEETKNLLKKIMEK